MDFQELYELADKEVTMGLADERLLSRAYAEVNGAAHGRQIYCQLRAEALIKQAAEPSGIVQISDLKIFVGQQETRRRTRKVRDRLIWAVACFGAFIGTINFSWFAYVAYAHGSSSAYAPTFLGVACFVLTVIACAASRYHTNTD